MIINFANLGGGGGGGTSYSAGDYIQISAGTISATGLTTEEHSEEVEGILAGAIADVNGRIPTIATTIDSASTDTEAASAKAVYDALGNVGGSDYLPEITTLPESPEDGAVYNYNGRLIKYVDGAGNWGEWLLCPSLNSSENKILRNPIVFEYAVVPSSMDGQLFYQGGMNDGNTNVKFYFDLTNDQLTGVTATSSTEADFIIPHNGTSVNVTFDGNTYIVKWENNRITINRGSYQYPKYNLTGGCSTEIATAHYELVKDVLPEPVVDAATATSTSYSAVFDNKGMVHPGAPIANNLVKQNGNWRNMVTFKGDSGFSDFWAPNAAGNVGELLVSAGPNGYTFTPPVWKTVAQALGVDFWTGTQDEYDALAPNYNATTLYIIVEED